MDDTKITELAVHELDQVSGATILLRPLPFPRCPVPVPRPRPCWPLVKPVKPTLPVCPTS